jgi:hypothetical protein
VKREEWKEKSEKRKVKKSSESMEFDLQGQALQVQLYL